jgi:heat shock protein HtpX
MWEQIRYNQIRSAILVLGMGALLLLLGFFYLGIPLAVPLKLEPIMSGVFGIMIAATIWVAMSLVAFLRGDNIILAISKARKITTDDFHRLNNIIEELKIASGLETIPSIYVIDDRAMNAFAIGCDPNKAAIIITSGLLTNLSRDELQGVIAHELAHIRNRDVLLMALCTVLLGTILTLTRILPKPFKTEPGSLLGTNAEFWTASIGLTLVFIVITLFLMAILSFRESGGMFSFSILLWIIWAMSVCMALVPMISIMAGIIYFAISRRREYLADATATLYTRYPEGLASALEKIAASTDQLKSATVATAPIYIVNPFRKRGMAASDVTNTHPPISERINILRSISHISYADYDRAYQKTRGTDKSVLPNYATAIPHTIAIRSPQPDDLDDIQRARETTNALWNLNNYKLISCPCGTKMRLPPSYKQPEIKCPHCGKVNPV